ncbi:unnamed protein product [Phaedon cochleariae]|uniref:PHD-type domain-containing protein n=1 Tax=Phaedon cochleariae TaxID=80249 RepID=A0A9N9SJN5_PHACE|nr:unnamed protein product [Phaedon cochleariae]
MADKLCKVCNKAVNRKNPGLQCGSFCARFYHGQCINIVGNQLDSLRTEGVSWKCLDCRSRSRTSVGASLSTELLAVNDALPGDSASNALGKIRAELRQIREQQALLLESVNFCSNKISDFENEIHKLNDYIRKTDQLFTENKKLKSDLDGLQSKMNDLEQVSRSNNIEIQGVPERNNEDLYNILEKIGTYIDCKINPISIDYVHRVQSNHNSTDNKTKNIIVKFISKREKDRFLLSAKTKRIGNNSSPKMSLDGVSDAFYINEHLTLTNKILYREAEQQKPRTSDKDLKTKKDKDSEIHGGTNNRNEANEDMELLAGIDSNDAEKVFKPEKSIPRSPTQNIIIPASSAPVISQEGTQKRPRSESSPELQFTKRQCEGTKNATEVDDQQTVRQNELTNSQMNTTEWQIMNIMTAIEKIEEVAKKGGSGGSADDNENSKNDLADAIDTKQTEGGFKNIKGMRNGAVIVESHNRSQQEKLKAELKNKSHITVKETQNLEPMFLITGIEKGFEDEELIKELVRLNSEIEQELGQDIQQDIKVIARRQCRNPIKENVVLQAPAPISKWFLKKQLVDFDLVKIHVQEHFNLAVCFKCCGFGHVAKYCSANACCHKCGGGHAGKDCTENEWKCPNCEKMKFGVAQHSARDINCPVYKKRLERFKQNINYESETFL